MSVRDLRVAVATSVVLDAREFWSSIASNNRRMRRATILVITSALIALAPANA